MGERTGIQWTDATWNPVTGCTEVSPGCEHCYAARMARGLLRRRYLDRAPVINTIDNQADPFAVRLWPERLAQPSKWQTPRMIFVCSMSDLFHRDIPREFIYQILDVMVFNTPWHHYQILTKRPARAASIIKSYLRHHASRWLTVEKLPRGVWIGTSVENQDFTYRIRQLLEVPAEIRFVSAEPLLGPLDLGPWLPCRGYAESLSWAILGGESGIRARALDLAWLRDLVRQCRETACPVFVKQLGTAWAKAAGARDSHGGNPDEWPEDLRLREYPKKLPA